MSQDCLGNSMPAVLTISVRFGNTVLLNDLRRRRVVQYVYLHTYKCVLYFLKPLNHHANNSFEYTYFQLEVENLLLIYEYCNFR